MVGYNLVHRNAPRGASSAKQTSVFATSSHRKRTSLVRIGPTDAFKGSGLDPPRNQKKLSKFPSGFAKGLT